MCQSIFMYLVTFEMLRLWLLTYLFISLYHVYTQYKEVTFVTNELCSRLTVYHIAVAFYQSDRCTHSEGAKGQCPWSQMILFPCLRYDSIPPPVICHALLVSTLLFLRLH